MLNIPDLKKQSNFRLGNRQMVTPRKTAAAVLPVNASLKPGLVLLDATVTEAKANDIERKLHPLVIGPQEATHEIVGTYQTYLAGLSPNG